MAEGTQLWFACVTSLYVHDCYNRDEWVMEWIRWHFLFIIAAIDAYFLSMLLSLDVI